MIFAVGLGYRVPELGEAQVANLQTALEANPGLRIMLVPLSVDPKQTMAHRRRMTEAARSIKGVEAELFVPIMDSDVTVLAEIDDDASSLSLGYLTAAGTLVTWDEYIRSLRETGEAIDGDSPDSVWTFSLLDPKPDAEPSLSTVEAMYPTVSRALTPDLVIALNILHAAGGHIPSANFKQLTNEFLVEDQDPVASLTTDVTVTCILVKPGRTLDIVMRFTGDELEGYGREKESTLEDPACQPIPGNDEEYIVKSPYLVRDAVGVAL